MPSRIRRAVRGGIRRLGWEVIEYDPLSSPWAALKRMLDHHGIDTVLDIGAHEGEFAQQLRGCGFAGRIVSFEPLPQAHATLSQRAKLDPDWVIAERLAIGDRDGTIPLNVAGNGQSSSVLPMLAAHVKSAPESAYVSVELVPVARLDTVFDRFTCGSCHVFMKIDVQGFEPAVLEGAGRVLDRVSGLQIELSLVPLYEGQVLFEAMHARLIRAGYELWNFAPVFGNRATGRLLQLDGIFFRPRAQT